MSKKSEEKQSSTKSVKRGLVLKTKPKPSHPLTSAPPAKRKIATKGGTLLGLLRKPEGVTVKEMMKATGWQAHSVRGFLSGAVKKRMGLVLKSAQSAKGDRRYMVSGA